MTTISGINFEEIAKEIKRHASESKIEEDLRIRIENLLRSKVFDKFGIPWASYEHKSKKLSTIKPGRKDAFYGRVIIEYEPPEKFKSKAGFEEAKNQVKRYIEEEAEKKEEYSKFFGVVIDGYSIGFIRFRKNKWEESGQPSDINEQTISTFLRAISGLQRKPIDVDYLLLDFGPRSELSKKVILNLYEILLKSKSKRTQILFDDWKRVFSQVCAYSKNKLEGLIEYYDLQDHKIIDVEKLMFAVHTYYTLLMKLLTSEIVSYFNIPYSFLERLENAYYKNLDELLAELKDLEEGGLIAKIGIRNFLEADYFAWYIDDWNKVTAELIIEIIKKLREYEPGTAELEPDRVKDLFKRLYQNLVPKKVRHDLGEYFTPDWLAELLLNEVGYDGDPDKRILDPACGSGTFLVLVIKRIRDYAEEHFITDKREVLTKIINNVVGIDLNPLAVLASRANYIIALGDLIRTVPKEGIEIPVYLADSILVSRGISLFTGKPEFVLETSAGKFWVREELINKKLWEPLLNAIEFCLRNNYSANEFKQYVNKIFVDSGFVSKDAYGATIRLYEQFLKLERKKLDGVWTKVIKNSFAPMLVGQFDYVIGNPPWVHWRSLPEHYRNSIKQLYDKYKLLPPAPYIPNVDLSMLFTYKCMDAYLKEGGHFGFLITQIVFKSYTGSGFLKFAIGKTPFKVLKVHDMVEIKPFEGAQNRTAMLIAVKGEQTKFPINYIVWRSLEKIDQMDNLGEALNKSKRFKTFAEPIGYKPRMDIIPPLSTLPKQSLQILKRITGKSPYKAHKGVDSIPSGVYWVEITNSRNGTVLIKNLAHTGKMKIKELELVVEKDLIFPIIRGNDIQPFEATHKHYIIAPYNQKGELLSENELKIKYPKTFVYFKNFETDLKRRFTFKGSIKKAFYSIYRFAPKVLAPYKVVWRDIATKVMSAVIFPVDDPYVGKKPVILDQTVIFIPFGNGDEAYYVSGILNSTIVNFIVKSYHHLHLQPQILKQINIPQFNPKSRQHKTLVKLSKKAHKSDKKEIDKILKSIDSIVAKLYNITDKDLKIIKDCFYLLTD